jgi:hypothetical protein
VHHDQLLDALFPHVHLVNGRVVTADTDQPAVDRNFASPALGAGAGASVMAIGSSVMPPASMAVLLPPIAVIRQLAPADEIVPVGHLEAPPDPPPIRPA